ncbi:hypothetical protein NQ314_003846 [Rhamnusium bicolor]|uniref:Uncharacterized protein n=1 Tax=Rhamnusium bicolor TaxID=1586634 RepID=A0AAV8ZNF4_9CUCU|nr:hypothetical protein NQ314_003846 [Rhamnusium bicolor]
MLMFSQPMKKPLGGPLTGNKSVYNKAVFKFQFPLKLLSRCQKHIPHLGLQSEYQGNYKLQISSDLYPYLYTTGVPFDESLSGAGPWQNLCPPGMYCSDQCHIGAGWPVRAVVGAGSKTYIPRDNTRSVQKTN